MQAADITAKIGVHVRRVGRPVVVHHMFIDQRIPGTAHTSQYLYGALQPEEGNLNRLERPNNWVEDAAIGVGGNQPDLLVELATLSA